MWVSTLNSAYNAEILVRYRRLFVKGDVFICEWSIFGAEVFLRNSQFFVKGNFVIGRVECMYTAVARQQNIHMQYGKIL